MGLVDLFKRKSDGGDPRAELEARLAAIAMTDALVRGGQDPATLYLATNVDEDGKVEGDRPTMRFRFDAERVGADAWQVRGTTAHGGRFTVDVSVAECPALDPATAASGVTPAVPLRFSLTSGAMRDPLARSPVLFSWRVEGGMDEASREAPLEVEATVMGTGLKRLDHAYVPMKDRTHHVALLKCHRGDDSVWLALDLATGDGELFPRRRETGSYRLALDVLLTFT